MIKIQRSIEPPGIRLQTAGLQEDGYSDIALDLSIADVESAGRELLQILADYQRDQGIAIKAGETVRHGYWVLLMTAGAGGILDVWELAADGSIYVRGAALALKYWIEQRAICEQSKVSFSPPSATQTAAISDGVMQGGLLVEGVRYPAPTQASGWFLTTERYTGDIKEMSVEHLYHVTAARPDLAKYLALPAGYRFEFGDGLGEVYPDDAQLVTS